MSRQIDVKALVSHIVRGDGADKCRICMGDTSGGHVYLTDTVMLDGDRPVTLIELLETITGIEVTLDMELPPGVCHKCFELACNANNFRNRCLKAATEWHNTISFLNSIEITEKDLKSIYCVIDNSVTLFEDNSKVYNSTAAGVRLTSLFNYSKNTFQTNQKTNLIKSTANCSDCGKEFVSPYLLYAHLKEASHNLRACYVCAKIMLKDNLCNHLLVKHNIDSYECRECKALFKFKKKYDQHVKKVHAIRNFTEQCSGCTKTFQNHKCYIYHIKICLNLKDSKQNLNIPIDDLKLEIKNNSHVTKVGQQDAKNKKCYCDYCGKSFAGRRFVSAHIQIVHMKNTHKPCIYCGKHYAAARMSDHIKSHQSNIYKCEYCDLEMKTRLGFLQHTRLHTGEKPYSCSYCMETFSAISRRSAHVRKVHMNSYITLKHSCGLCLARFKVPYRLRKHMASAHGVEDKDNVFGCSICSKKFSRNGLVHHMKKHQRNNMF